jgi:hypothetical protein
MANASTARFEAAERRLFGAYELEVDSRFLETGDPPVRTRVMESGDGEPLVLVHAGAGSVRPGRR